MKPTVSPKTIAEFSAQFPKMAEELGPENLELLLEDATVLDVAADRVIIRDRMPVESIYFVLDGTLDVSIENHDISHKIAVIKPGEWFGEISVLSGERIASATITTRTPCKLVKVHHITLENLIHENMTVSQILLNHFIALMAQRFRAPLTRA